MVEDKLEEAKKEIESLETEFRSYDKEVTIFKIEKLNDSDHELLEITARFLKLDIFDTSLFTPLQSLSSTSSSSSSSTVAAASLNTLSVIHEASKEDVGDNETVLDINKFKESNAKLGKEIEALKLNNQRLADNLKEIDNLRKKFNDLRQKLIYQRELFQLFKTKMQEFDQNKHFIQHIRGYNGHNINNKTFTVNKNEPKFKQDIDILTDYYTTDENNNYNAEINSKSIRSANRN